MRDRAKYHYVTIGIPRDLEELSDLQKEAALYDVSLPKFLSMLLIDRHLSVRGKGQGIWFPHGMTITPAQAEPQENATITDTLQMRAIAAASAWDE